MPTNCGSRRLPNLRLSTSLILVRAVMIMTFCVAPVLVNAAVPQEACGVFSTVIKESRLALDTARKANEAARELIRTDMNRAHASYLANIATNIGTQWQIKYNTNKDELEKFDAGTLERAKFFLTEIAHAKAQLSASVSNADACIQEIAKRHKEENLKGSILLLLIAGAAGGFVANAFKWVTGGVFDLWRTVASCAAAGVIGAAIVGSGNGLVGDVNEVGIIAMAASALAGIAWDIIVDQTRARQRAAG